VEKEGNTGGVKGVEHGPLVRAALKILRVTFVGIGQATEQVFFFLHEKRELKKHPKAFKHTYDNQSYVCFVKKKWHQS